MLTYRKGIVFPRLSLPDEEHTKANTGGSCDTVYLILLQALEHVAG